MATPGSTKSRAGVNAPEKGSFPLDHFKECSDVIEKYLACVQKHEKMPKRCQKIQLEYLNCRMENGLMKKEKMEDLGFTKQNAYESEIDQKINLIKYFAQIDKEARESVQNYFIERDSMLSENNKENVNDYFSKKK